MSGLAGGSHRVAILVVGMHRSGTSALARVLNLLGCDLPATLLGANKSNATGHWESEAICRLNDRVLESAGSRWDDWLAVNDGWLRSPKASQFREEALEVLGQEYGRSHLFVVKDPRLCRILPFWLGTLEAVDIAPLVISPLRNPLEVAASLERRNGFDPAFGMLLWLRHVLDSEMASRGRPRLFTTYDGLLAGWGAIAGRAQETLGIAWPRMTDNVAAEIQGFLQEAHRHHQRPASAVTDDPTLGRWLRDSFGILSRWAEAGESTDDFPALDHIRGEFNAAAPMFGRLIAAGQTATRHVRKLKDEAGKSAEQLKAVEATQAQALERAQKAEAELASRSVEAALLQEEVAAARSRFDKQQTQTRAVEADLARQIGLAEAAQADLSAERDHAARLRDDLAAMRQEAADAARRLADLEAGQAQQREATARAEADLAEAREALDKAREDAAAAERRAESKDWRIASLQSDVERQGIATEVAQAALAAERSAARRLEFDLTSAREAAADLAGRVSALQAERDERAAAADRAEAALSQMRDRLAQTESALAQRRLETEQTAEELAAARAELDRLNTAREEDRRAIGGMKEHVEFLLRETEDQRAAMAKAERDHRQAAQDKDARLAAAERKAQETRTGPASWPSPNKPADRPSRRLKRAPRRPNAPQRTGTPGWKRPRRRPPRPNPNMRRN